MRRIFRSIKYRLATQKKRDFIQISEYLKDHNGVIRFSDNSFHSSFDLNGQLYKCILRDDSSDLKVFLQVFSKNEYLTLVRAVSDNADAKPLIIVDLGANIGLTALYLSAFLPVQKYIALEPSTENFALLCKNF